MVKFCHRNTTVHCILDQRVGTWCKCEIISSSISEQSFILLWLVVMHQLPCDGTNSVTSLELEPISTLHPVSPACGWSQAASLTGNPLLGLTAASAGEASELGDFSCGCVLLSLKLLLSFLILHEVAWVELTCGVISTLEDWVLDANQVERFLLCVTCPCERRSQKCLTISSSYGSGWLSWASADKSLRFCWVAHKDSVRKTKLILETQKWSRQKSAFSVPLRNMPCNPTTKPEDRKSMIFVPDSTNSP